MNTTNRLVKLCTSSLSVPCGVFRSLYNMTASTAEDNIDGFVPLVRCHGILFPERMARNIVMIDTFSVRDDDIYICNFPKCGTHWTWEIVNMLVAGRPEYARHWGNCAFLEERPQKELDKQPSPRIFFTHLYPSHLPKDIWNRKCHVINVQRNPKDAIVSDYFQEISQNWIGGHWEKCFYGTWDQYMELQFKGDIPNGSILDHMKAWNSFPQEHPDVPFCQLHFEDLKKNPVHEVRRLAEFLGRPLPEETYKQIADLCNFKNLKEASEKVKDQTFHMKWKDGTSGYFRKGETGGWKTQFTVSQSERFDRLYLDKIGYAFPY